MPSKKLSKKQLHDHLKKIRMVVMDVDGVMTDGRIILDANGAEYKSFDVHDGYGIARARTLGIQFAIISGRKSKPVSHRAKRLNITDVIQGRVDKVTAFHELNAKHNIPLEEVCFIGDDEFDMPLLSIVGLSVAPANAIAKVKANVHYVTNKSGGRGAVRELLDMILESQSLL